MLLKTLTLFANVVVTLTKTNNYDEKQTSDREVFES